MESVCSGLSSAKAEPKALTAISSDQALTAISSSVHSLATDVKHGVVLHVTHGLERMQLMEARRTELVSLDDLKTALTDALQEAKKVFLEALGEAIGEVAQEIVKALSKAMESLKTELASQADKAVAAATEALGALKESLTKFPDSVKTAMGGLCQPLGPDMQEACGSGTPDIDSLNLSAPSLIGPLTYRPHH